MDPKNGKPKFRTIEEYIEQLNKLSESIPERRPPQFWCPVCESYNIFGVPMKPCGEAHTRAWLRGGFEFPLPPLYTGLSFDSFIPYVPSLQRKLNFLKQWVTGDHARSLFLFGTVGSGKSHLQAGTFRELALKGFHVAFIRVLDFLSECYAPFDRDSTPGKIVKKLTAHQYLFLDDLGTEKPTEFKRERLFDLVDVCYTRKTKLVITSNSPLKDLDELDTRTLSRLTEMCDLLQFSEPDYRVGLAQEQHARSVAAPPNLELERTF